MLGAAWLMLSTLLYSLQLSTGSFPKPLSPQEERHYLELSAKGDLEARNILVQRNLRLVAHIMKKYYALSADQEDLISIGTIGLIKGVSTFDPQKSSRLATYAARCVENPILSPRTLRNRTGWWNRQNHPTGVFWIVFRRIATSFAGPRIIMCGIVPYISFSSTWMMPTEVDMKNSGAFRSGSVACGTAVDCSSDR